MIGNMAIGQASRDRAARPLDACLSDCIRITIAKSRKCVLILSNDVRAEAGFADLVHAVLGDTGVPYDWEYGDRAGKS